MMQFEYSCLNNCKNGGSWTSGDEIFPGAEGEAGGAAVEVVAEPRWNYFLYDLRSEGPLEGRPDR